MDSDSKKYLAIGGALVVGGIPHSIQSWACFSSKTKSNKLTSSQ